MPGIVGIVKQGSRDTAATLTRARAMLRYEDGYADDPVFEDEKLLCTRTHLGTIGERTSPARRGNCCLWLEGECYNHPEIARMLVYEATGQADFLLQSYEKGVLEKALGLLDGNFAAVLYDLPSGKIHCISDRFGLKPLYFWRDGQHFAWSSEQKGFLGLASFSPQINTSAVAALMDIGYLPGRLTWFKNVELLDAATILTFDLKTTQIERRRYWKWSSIRPQHIAFADAVGHYHQLLEKAARRHLSDNQKTMISLSGGMDSRSLLAASPNPAKLNAFTFGAAQSWDVRFAKQVTAVKKTPHRFFILTPENWLEGKLENIWRSDGMIGIMHLHASPFVATFRESGAVNLNAAAGALAFKGTVAEKFKNRSPDKALAEKIYGNYAEFVPTEDLANAAFADPIFFDSHIRKFTLNGAAHWSKVVEQRYPMLSNELMEYCFSLPESYRLYSRLDRAAMLQAYPEFFKTIPWQMTGLPVGKAFLTELFLRFKIRKIQYALGLLPEYPIANYTAWLRRENAAALIVPFLRRKGSVYTDFTADDFYEKYWLPHWKGKQNFTEKIGRAVALEYWLRCVLNHEK